MLKIALLLTIGLAASWGSTIDQGNVFTRPYFVSDATAVNFNISSSDGGFTVFGPGMLGGGNVGCSYIGAAGECAFGTYSIQAFFPDASSHPASANAIIDGTSVGSVLLGCAGPSCPHTSLFLTAQPVNISAPGSYSVPFSATGQIQAAQNVGDPFILDQTVSGVGSLYFSVFTTDPGYFQFAVAQGNGPFGLEWQFKQVPEPSMILPTMLGLAAIQWRRRSKRKG
jgi:hypothetical protein